MTSVNARVLSLDTRVLSVDRRVVSRGLGVTFAPGWTPCIAHQPAGDPPARCGQRLRWPPVHAGVLPRFLGVPFLLVAGLTDRLQGPIRRLNRYLGVVNVIGGVVLLVLGLLLLTDRFTFFNRFSAPSPFDI